MRRKGARGIGFMSIIHLPDRGVVKVVGEDSRTFLDGLVTCDMDKVAPGRPGFGALLTPQGKVMFDFFIVEAEAADGGGFFLDTLRLLAPELVQRLNLYRLRARVIIEDLSDILGVAAVMEDAPFDPEDYLACADPRLAALGTRLIGERNGLAAQGGDPEAYHARRIGLGVPEGGKDFAFNDAFPHEVLMDRIGGVDFQKGCYVGQEVVSRMQHRGGARTRIVPVAYEGGFAPVEGIDVVAGGRTLGRTGSQHRGQGLAMLRLDRLADAAAAGVPVTAGGIGLAIRKAAPGGLEAPGADV